MRQSVIFILLIMIIASLPACGFQTPSPIPIYTDDLATPIAQTLQAYSTLQSVETTADAQEAVATAVLGTQQARATGTEVIKQTQTQATAAFQSTQTAAVRATATAQANLQATQTALPMQSLVESLAKNGYIKSTAGTYYQIETFDESWARLNWYRWWESGYSPTNFVIHTQTSWWSASRTADWWASGCGFVFHETDAKNHYFIGLALDGVVSLHKMENGNFTALASNTYIDKNTPDGSAEITLAVDKGKITFFVNGKEILSDVDDSLAAGDLALSLISGTNKDFGTRCQMTDIELWILD